MSKLFYIIYNSYYKHGNYRKDIPQLTVFGIFAGIMFALILLSIIAFKVIQDPYMKGLGLQKSSYYILGIIGAVIVYFLFYHQKRYESIYDKYKDNAFLNSKKAKILGFSTAIFLIVSPLIFGLVRNKIVFDYWV